MKVMSEDAAWIVAQIDIHHSKWNKIQIDWNYMP